MDEETFWKQLETEFSSLSGDYAVVWTSGQFETGPDGELRFWKETPVWAWTQFPSLGKRADFEILAARGARRLLGVAVNDAPPDVWKAWLDEIKRRDLADFQIRQQDPAAHNELSMFKASLRSYHVVDGETQEDSAGTIYDVKGASARLCKRLQDSRPAPDVAKPQKATQEQRDFGVRLKRARTAARLSQRDAAKAMRIHRSSMQGHESGEVVPSDGMLKKYRKLYPSLAATDSKE